MLHWLLRQVASVLLPGTRLTLAGAAEVASAADLCVDVVWALEVWPACGVARRVCPCCCSMPLPRPSWLQQHSAGDAGKGSSHIAGGVPLPQASLGLVLPTLLVWREQLAAARRHAARHPGTAAEAELAGSAYERLCAPVLETADAFGGAAVPTVLGALAGYVASLLVREAWYEA